MSAKPNNKDEFLETFAHDLKSPLSGILNYLQMVEQVGDLNAQQSMYLQRVAESTHRALKMINDMLDFSRLEAVTLKYDAVDMRAVAEGVLLALEAQIESAGVNVKLDMPASLPMVRGDDNMLHHMMMNLVSNAIKYNRPQGDVDISAEQEGNGVMVRVRDTGVGIPSQELTRVFERFYRAKEAKKRRIEGTGLGLAIVLRIAEAHGGRVEVTSEEGIGSEFKVWLPLFISDGSLSTDMLRHTPDLLRRNRAEEAIDAVDDDTQEAFERDDKDSFYDQP
jgi:signal transduction histidine kinase